MKKRLIKGGAMALACCAFAGTLVSFSSMKEDDKKKKYHIVHRENGEVVTYDTILPMNSAYTVEQFLTDHDISDEGVKIMNIPMLHFNEESFDHPQMFIHEFSENIELEGKDGIKILSGDNCNAFIRKYMNGEEVELTDRNKKKIIFHSKEIGEGDSKTEMDLQLEGVKVFKLNEAMENENMRIMIEVDDEGNKTIKKFVNGEEVEASDSDMNELDFDHEKLLEEIQLKMKEIGSNSETGNIDKQIIIRKGEIDQLEEQIEFIIGSECSVFDGDCEKGKEHVQVICGDDDKDFTIVLVMENYEEGLKEKRAFKAHGNNSSIVYPNPNDGSMKIRFEQDEGIKTNVQIRDAAGRLVFEEDLGVFSGLYEKEVNLIEHGAGTYFMTIYQGEEKQIEKIIVQ